jgi:hypothetical protein
VRLDPLMQHFSDLPHGVQDESRQFGLTSRSPCIIVLQRKSSGDHLPGTGQVGWNFTRVEKVLNPENWVLITLPGLLTA